MADCKHLSVKCFCGAAPNSPDCKGFEQEYCTVTEEACDHDGDQQMCWRYEEHRADVAELLLTDIARYLNAHASDATYEGMKWAYLRIGVLLPEKRTRDD